MDGSLEPIAPIPLSVIPADESPGAIRERVPMLKARIDFDYMRLAKDIWLIYSNSLYLEWGYETFDDYIVAEFDASRDRADRLRRLWSRLVIDAGIAPKQLEGLSYTNAQVVAQVVRRETAGEWLSLGKTLTYRALQAKVDATKPVAAVITPSASSAVPSAPLTLAPAARKYVFYLHEDQAKVLDEAMLAAERAAKSSKDGHKLSCIALEFLAARTTREGTNEGRLRFYMRHLETIYGGSLIHVLSPKGFDALRAVIEANPELFQVSDNSDHSTAIDETGAQ